MEFQVLIVGRLSDVDRKAIRRLVGGVENLRDEYAKRLLEGINASHQSCLLYTSPSPRDLSTSRMPSSA